ncbi:tRNA (guanosine(37)-N1)-methyltransferase TrmD [Senegalimassilia faecalis]|uniref:tRNA (guanosine(37)-N1)-methyltransferase TrmD n=1 Tax=Senegalimassilia faecalis TaxID=2509433 RepID=UPI003078083A
MIIETLSTFPDMYASVMGASMMRIAQEKGILEFHAHDLRDWTHDRHRTTDDEPYGGGDGLVMKCAPIFEAYEDICSRASKPYTIFLAPQGRRFDDAAACELAKQDHLLFICGHYEGIDERAYTLADQVISLGDYVLTSGELASMVVIDAVVRKLPGVLGAETGALGESFADGLLEYPQYTRPANFNGMEVPPVLLSGNHGAVDVWRRQQSLERTWRLRPDLLEGVALTDADRAFLQSLSTADGR